MRFLLAGLFALVLIGGASAQPQRAQTVRSLVCTQPQTLWTKPVRGTITQAIPYVGPHAIETQGVGQADRNGEFNTVEGAGYGVIFRISYVGKNKPVRFRVASVRGECVSVRLFIAWR